MLYVENLSYEVRLLINGMENSLRFFMPYVKNANKIKQVEIYGVFKDCTGSYQQIWKSSEKQPAI